MENMQKTGEKAPGAIVVAKVVWEAANSHSNKMRYIAGTGAKMLLSIRTFILLNWFFCMVKSVAEKGHKK